MLTLLLTLAIFVLSLMNLARVAIYMLGADAHDRKRNASRKQSRSNYVPMISIIVPAHNEESVIVRNLDSIYANRYWRKEVIVVDDGSTDSTYHKLRYYKRSRGLKNLRILHQVNQGKATAINNGIKHAKGSLIMVLDADSYLAPNALREVITYFRDSRIVMTAANIKIIDDGTLFGLVQKFEYLISYRMKRAQTAFNIEYIIGGIGSTFRKRIAHRVGFYDTDTVTEDIDFTMKILRQGNKHQRVAYASTVIAHTEPVMTFAQLVGQRFRWKYGRMQTFIKNWRLFWNISPKYDKRLTLVQLPYAMWGEFVFLFEPVMIGFLAYIVIRFGDFTTLISAYTVTTVYIALNIIAEETETLRSKQKLLLLTPIQYPLFFMLSAVEYIALMKIITHTKQLVRGDSGSKWQHVARAGKAVSFN